MSDEQRMILQMLQSGKITPEEAERLIGALPTDDSEEPTASTPYTAPPEMTLSQTAPDMRRFRRHWEIPFFVGLVLMGVAGLCVSNTGNLIALICGWSALATAFLITLIGWFSQYSPWIHVRINEQHGHNIAFSLPLPLRLADPFVALARPFVYRFAPKDVHQYFDIAATFTTLLDDMPTDEPITIEVDEDDGDRVQVFLG